MANNLIRYEYIYSTKKYIYCVYTDTINKFAYIVIELHLITRQSTNCPARSVVSEYVKESAEYFYKKRKRTNEKRNRNRENTVGINKNINNL